MSSQPPETSVSAGTLPADDRPSGFSLDVEERSIGDAFKGWVGKLRTGDPGALPSVLGLVVLALIFMQVSDRFLSAYNLGNLPGQGSYIAVIALGLVFVLLLGEIDLSAGTAGGTCAAIAAVAVFSGNLHQGLPGLLYWSLLVGMAGAIALAVWLKAYSGAAVVLIGLVLIATNLTQHLIPALIAAICIGAAIGVGNGYLVAKIGIPSFVVTLALFLAWQGVLQFALAGQPVNTSNYALWHDLTYGNLSPLLELGLRDRGRRRLCGIHRLCVDQCEAGPSRPRQHEPRRSSRRRDRGRRRGDHRAGQPEPQHQPVQGHPGHPRARGDRDRPDDRRAPSRSARPPGADTSTRPAATRRPPVVRASTWCT